MIHSEVSSDIELKDMPPLTVGREDGADDPTLENGHGISWHRDAVGETGQGQVVVELPYKLLPCDTGQAT